MCPARSRIKRHSALIQPVRNVAAESRRPFITAGPVQVPSRSEGPRVRDRTRAATAAIGRRREQRARAHAACRVGPRLLAPVVGAWVGKSSRPIEELTPGNFRIIEMSRSRRRRLVSFRRGRALEILRVSFLPANRPATFDQNARKWGEGRAYASLAWRCSSLGVALMASTITGARADTVVLPTFDVVATTPLGGGEINVAQYPFAVWQTGAQDIQTFTIRPSPTRWRVRRRASRSAMSRATTSNRA